jgi:hypothetical protein
MAVNICKIIHIGRKRGLKFIITTGCFKKYNAILQVIVATALHTLLGPSFKSPLSQNWKGLISQNVCASTIASVRAMVSSTTARPTARTVTVTTATEPRVEATTAMTAS